ncbi:MAG: hypothetical protein KatS3mg053_0217 [Candidatus Roseilinea sp.]|nr:MAG: hypothetical protein KatS3mg053_0217 [Candidatus Roseilinea sp.]
MKLATRIATAAFICIAMAAMIGCAPASGTDAPAFTPLPYTDDFSNPNSGWQTLSDLNADVKYDGGGLRIIVKLENLTQWSAAGQNFKDAVFEVDARPNGGPTDNGFGVLFRMQDRKNFYHFAISSDGYWRAGYMRDGDWENWDDWQPHPAIKLGSETNRIKVVMRGNELAFFVNDQPISSKQDDTFASGDIGVFALTLIDKPGTDVTFDNVRVTAVE